MKRMDRQTLHQSLFPLSLTPSYLPITPSPGHHLVPYPAHVKMLTETKKRQMTETGMKKERE